MLEQRLYSAEKPRGHEIGRTGIPYTPSAEGVYDYRRGLGFKPVFSKPGANPFEVNGYTGEKIEYEYRTASINEDGGTEIFKQQDIEVPATWSALATKVVASKYFYGDLKIPGDREQSAPVLVDRVARTITDMGVRDGYFATPEDAAVFYNELVSLNLNQFVAFNSPVWFNTGLYHQYGVGKTSGAGNYYFDKTDGQVKQAPTQYEKPQVSACFIQQVDDTMESIMDLARSEAMLFKYGSGSGTDLSTLRSTRETLAGGGKPSGPLSFLRIYDAVASVIKSGGKTRRAAKMNTLKDWHPDVKEFIEAKTNEEKKAWALIEQGYSGDFNGEAYGSVDFQNENLSVRVSDAFMRAALEDKDWTTHFVTDPSKPGPTYKARDMLRWMAEGTWTCGDPGVQYEDTIQKWHTAKNTAPINSSNPCSEYMFLDNTACNLASLNLKKFIGKDGKFDVQTFKSAVEIMITAQEIVVDNASYPTPEIAKRSHVYRTLGLGYANLGALLMTEGLPYSSDEGREVAKAITALMHNQAYLQSARIAGKRGAFEGYEENRDPMLKVVGMHKEATDKINPLLVPETIRETVEAAKRSGLEMMMEGEKHGFRNAQVTVLAPTGTIGFMMDCDTTGIEPDIALVKNKLLAGGGNLRIINQSVGPALERLKYSPEERAAIIQYIDTNETIEGAPGLKEEHLAVFDCAFKPRKGKRSIHYNDHLKMMAAVQPFLSGAISKTVNMPTHATVEEIEKTYINAWQMGLKAVALYRDGCKRSQPVSAGKREDETSRDLSKINFGDLEKELAKVGKRIVSVETSVSEVANLPAPIRQRLPQHRLAVTSKYDMGGEHEFYITTGYYDNGKIGESFLTAAKEGSFANGMADIASTFISMVLQNGVPVEKVAEHLIGTNFEPSGFVQVRNEGGLLSSLIKNPVQGRVNSVGELLGKHLLVARDLGYSIAERMTGAKKEQEPVTTEIPVVASPSSDKDKRALDDEKAYAEFIKGKELGKTCMVCQKRMIRADNHCKEICFCGNVSTEGCSG
ncbi:vitamin B12-dependent ribonucleotide reductase [Candidatus Pacearchaeota archaeon]|nr:vitamin B12-dependent ribonucleotide reductase [Candidatus Pacearchaeota archaeon]